MEAATSQELRERLIQLERLIELNVLDSKQAAVNVRGSASGPDAHRWYCQHTS